MRRRYGNPPVVSAGLIVDTMNVHSVTLPGGAHGAPPQIGDVT